jgi:ribosomal protein L7/L12
MGSPTPVKRRLSSLKTFCVTILIMSLHQTFHCPNCNAALDLAENNAAIVRCDYCHSVVIVPESLRDTTKAAREEKPAPKKPSRPAKPTLTEEEAVAKVTQLARNGQQIEAMKLYRETYPVGLKETKDAIDQTASGLPLPIPTARWEDEEDLPVAAAEEITHLVALGQIEEAASLYRVTFGTSHVEAKTAVEQLVEGKSIDTARHKARQEAQATAVRREGNKSSQSGSFKLFGVGVSLFILIVIMIFIALVVIFVF